jgi:hypothetical protein
MPFAQILRLIAVLFVALAAPKGAMARVRRLDLVTLWNLLDNLEWMQRRGRRFRYPGESFARAAARLDLVLWIAVAPSKALRHLTRRFRGLARARHLRVMPPSFAPPRLAPSPLAAACGLRAAAADT